ncbi:hypothetical protein TRFO_32002 [Tritrichomonas foetus]|uniref:Uncharacterized protein n=1 Tax=Tritrichomonas foetus TaxID=1144522 RepID=A0A1J4JVC8_9EUKA|nr:hypothetical protein TRFO_32002 [Tritrichomonas foetus]|eukprot:OHT01221.1 hypothetical protein TRFO_32002 [Tritrichomonas foetus]
MSVDRGLRGLLAAACVVQCPVPFTCRPRSFEEDGETATYKVIEGMGIRTSKKSKSDDQNDKQNDNTECNEGEIPSEEGQNDTQNADKSESGRLETEMEQRNDALLGNNNEQNDNNENNDSPEEEEEEMKEPEFDYIFNVKDRTIEGDQNTEFSEDIMTICEHLRNGISLLYDAGVIDISLKFGAKNDGHEIWLLDGIVITTQNGFTQNLMRTVPNGETAFTNFLLNQLSEVNDDKKKCYSKFPNCLQAIYKVPRIFVILNRAHQQFPTVNEARLYKMIKHRILSINDSVIDQTVNVCISCVHLYTAEQRTYQGQKATNKLPKEVPPPTFAALVPAELSIKGMKDVGLNPNQHKPYCYKINCRDSPYRDPIPIAKKPPDPPERTRISPIKKSEKWVARMLNPYTMHTVKVVQNDKSTKKSTNTNDNTNNNSNNNDSNNNNSNNYTNHNSTNNTGREKNNNVNKNEYVIGNELEIPVIERTRKSYSEQMAPATYANKPFTYSFLNKLKKKNEAKIRRSQLSSRPWKNEYQ